MKANVFISDALKGECVESELALLSLFGELDNADGDKVFQKITGFSKKNPQVKGYIFDFGQVETINSKAIGNLVLLQNTINKTGGRVAIVRPSSEVQKLLNMIGVDRKIEIYSDLESAKNALAETASSSFDAKRL